MQSQWSPRWAITGHNRKLRGGQGYGQRVHDATGHDGFLKLLSRPADVQARKRFTREVSSFSTLSHPGLPKLLDENSDDWRNRELELFLVLEYIEGCTLAEFVEQSPGIDLATALSTIRPMVQIVAHCHENDVVHRDIKPKNIVLRRKDPADPVLVDFGLSFNSARPEVDSITRVGEEIGNRFLRLPEHATGGRSPVSDLTQIVGLLLYMLTKSEPRVLENEDGLKPHQRDAERDALIRGTPSGHLIRLLDLFDRAFSTRIDGRFETASELADALDRLMRSEPETKDMSELLDAIALKTADPREQALMHNGSILQAYVDHARRTAETLAKTYQLHWSWGQGPDDMRAAQPYRQLRLALHPPGIIPKIFAELRIDLYSDNDVRVTANSKVVWRGSDPSSPEFAEAITRPVIELYLAPTD